MAVRQKFVERRWSRKTINARVERIRIPLYAAAARGLRPGGVLVLEAYAPDQIGRGTGGPRDPDMLAALAELIAELDGLEFLHARELERDVREGAYHSAVASVVQVIGVRQHRGSEASS